MFVTVGGGRDLVQCQLLKERISADCSEQVQWFGMSVTVEGKIVRVYHALSDCRELVEKLIAEINSGDVYLNHLEFILDDWFDSL